MGQNNTEMSLFLLQLIIPWKTQVNSFYNCNVPSPSEALPQTLLFIFVKAVIFARNVLKLDENARCKWAFPCD